MQKTDLQPNRFVNRENRVPYYQKLFQEGGKQHIRQWNQVRTPPHISFSHSYFGVERFKWWIALSLGKEHREQGGERKELRMCEVGGHEMGKWMGEGRR